MLDLFVVESLIKSESEECQKTLDMVIGDRPTCVDCANFLGCSDQDGLCADFELLDD